MKGVECMDFGVEELLKMDYRLLRKYMEEAVSKNPSIGVNMREIGVKHLLEPGSMAPAHMARLRCISAYIGMNDPCKKSSGGK